MIVTEVEWAVNTEAKEDVVVDVNLLFKLVLRIKRVHIAFHDLHSPNLGCLSEVIVDLMSYPLSLKPLKMSL